MNVTLNVSVLLCAENKLWAPRTDSGALGTQGHGRGAGVRRLALGSAEGEHCRCEAAPWWGGDARHGPALLGKIRGLFSGESAQG